MKRNKGITLISLIITIIIMVILASVMVATIDGSDSSIETTSNNNKLFELQEIQQVVMETYIKYKQTGNKDYLVGTICSEEELLKYEEEFDKLTFKDRSDGKLNYSNYYILDNQNDLNKLDLQDSKDYYIVNYTTGEVFNYTSKVTTDGKVLYVHATE